MTPTAGRLIVIGSNSQVWRRVRAFLTGPEMQAISHRDLAFVRFSAEDLVWVLSYSKRREENRDLFRRLRAAGARRVIYVSSATANIAKDFRCYRYPTAKFEAEQDAREILDAQVVRLGVVYDQVGELPAGPVAISSIRMIADAIEASVADGPTAVPECLFEVAIRPFLSSTEQFAYRIYGALMAFAPSPCLLRPLDFLLRVRGWRWYGYVYLSNRKWLATKS